MPNYIYFFHQKSMVCTLTLKDFIFKLWIHQWIHHWECISIFFSVNQILNVKERVWTLYLLHFLPCLEGLYLYLKWIRNQDRRQCPNFFWLISFFSIFYVRSHHCFLPVFWRTINCYLPSFRRIPPAILLVMKEIVLWHTYLSPP